MIYAIQEIQYEQELWGQTVSQYVANKLDLDPMPEVNWSDDGLRRLAYLYPLPGDQMTDLDWTDWALLWAKYDTYA